MHGGTRRVSGGTPGGGALSSLRRQPEAAPTGDALETKQRRHIREMGTRSLTLAVLAILTVIVLSSVCVCLVGWWVEGQWEGWKGGPTQRRALLSMGPPPRADPMTRRESARGPVLSWAVAYDPRTPEEWTLIAIHDT